MGRFILCRVDDQRTGTQGMGAYPGDRETGGMAKAIETGVPKMRIEEAAARTQARIDSGYRTIVGTNKYRLEHEDPLISWVDNRAVRKQQEESLKELRANRDEKKVKETLAALTECVRTGEATFEKAAECAKVRCTLGEISDACEGSRADTKQ